jgi:hypothetical protein
VRQKTNKQKINTSFKVPNGTKVFNQSIIRGASLIEGDPVYFREAENDELSETDRRHATGDPKKGGIKSNLLYIHNVSFTNMDTS